MGKSRSGEGRAETSLPTPDPSTVAWAHVSDFHFKTNQDYGRDEVIQALLRDLEMVSGQRAAERGVEPLALDFVVVTGDVAYSGQREQYEVALRFFEELSRAAGVPRERIFVVPGNHDVDRSRDVTEFMSIVGPDALRRAWDRLALRRALGNEKLAAYRAFAASLNEHLRGPEEQPGGFAHTLDIRGHKVALLGLSSCWLSGQDSEQGRLIVGMAQAYDIADGVGLSTIEEADLKVALLHHPLAWLQAFDQGDMESLLAKHVDLVLHGHLHRTGLTLQSTPGRVLRAIAAGAAYAGSQYPNAYNIARASLGTQRRLDFWLRAYAPEQRCFVADNRTYPVAEAGRWSWRIDGGAQPPATEPAPAAATAVDERAYLEALVESTRWFDVRGVNTELQKQPELDGVYTRLRVTTSAPPTAFEPGHKSARYADLEHAAVRDLPTVLGDHRHVVLIGDPGSGKSTFLRWVALNLARAGLGPDGGRHLAHIGLSGPAPLPILVRLGDFGQFLERQDARRWPDLSVHHLASYLDELPFELKVSLPPGHLWNRIQGGDCCLLLDGLDEVATEGLRRRVRAIVEAALKPENRHVITCRTRAYDGQVQLAGGLRHCRLMDLDAVGVETFVWLWSRAHRGVPRHEADTPAALDADEYGRGLLTAVRAHEHVRHLATNPLMLTTLACVYHGRKRLPELRAELYEEALTTLLLTRPSTDSRETEAIRREALQRLAMSLFEGGARVRRSLSLAEAARALEPLLESEDSARTFAMQEELRSGLLVSREVGEVEFHHPTFADYLMAKALSVDRDYWSRLRPHLRDERWGEVILLLAGCLRRNGLSSSAELITQILLGVSDDSDMERARSVGLIGRILRDIEPYGGDAAGETGYTRALRRTLAIFERDSTVPERERVDVGEALGRAGDPRIHEDDLGNRVWIEGGTFLMGAQRAAREAPGYEEDAQEREGPLHEVRLSPYRIDRYPVTVQKYRRFMDAGPEGYRAEQFWTSEGWAWSARVKREAPGNWEDQVAHPNRPVVHVSWYEALAYCAWLSEQHVGWRVALPTEAQWEFAARGSEGRKYPWGWEAPSDRHANFGMRRDAATPVRIYPLGATAAAVHDMAGNVWEWCADWLANYDAGMQRDPVGPERGTSRVLRGGAFNDDPGHLRSAFRYFSPPTYDHPDVGFRCVWMRPGGQND